MASLNSTSIMGHNIVFPEGKKPFSSQLAIMSKCLLAFTRKSNALIESPTGTGKTLALLTASLSYQQKVYEQQLAALFTSACSVSAPTAASEDAHPPPPQAQQAPQPPPAQAAASPTRPRPPPDKPLSLHSRHCAPRIYYCSRTHSQLRQVVAELRNLPDCYQDSLHMSVLGSRTQLCVNPRIRRTAEEKRTSIDAECKKARDEKSCRFYFDANVVASAMTKLPRAKAIPYGAPINSNSNISSSSSNSSGCDPEGGGSATAAEGCGGGACGAESCESKTDAKERVSTPTAPATTAAVAPTAADVADWVHATRTSTGCTINDIEDLVSLGQSLRGCSYFASRAGVTGTPAAGVPKSQLIFAPYNYLLNPSIRASMEIDLRGSIVIFDEAHNIEDISRSEVSFELTLKSLIVAVKQLSDITAKPSGNLPHFQVFLKLARDLLRWFNGTKLTLEMPPAGADGSSHFDNSGSGGSSYRSQSNSSYSRRGNGSYSGHNGGNSAGGGSGFNSDPNSLPNVWGGMEALGVLDRECDINADTLAVFEEHLATIVAQADDVGFQAAMEVLEGGASAAAAGLDPARGAVPGLEDEEVVRLDDGTTALLKGLLQVLGFLFMQNKRFAGDYKMVMQLSGGGGGFGSGSADDKLCFWCMNPAVGFDAFKSICHSIVLTSGTLSPLDSFASELDVAFPVRLESSHVINVPKQVFTYSVANYAQVCLNAVYANQNSRTYQMALGVLLKIIVSATPGGVLLFFPSYGMMDKMYQCWGSQGTGSGFGPSEGEMDDGAGAGNPMGYSLLEDLTKNEGPGGAEVFVEPKGSSSGGGHNSSESGPETGGFADRRGNSSGRRKNPLDSMLQRYYATIDSGRKAVLLAVCRGKVSEGINFSDDYARCILVAGIPYPSTMDLGVRLKRSYQDERVAAASASRVAAAMGGGGPKISPSAYKPYAPAAVKSEQGQGQGQGPGYGQGQGQGQGPGPGYGQRVATPAKFSPASAPPTPGSSACTPSSAHTSATSSPAASPGASPAATAIGGGEWYRLQAFRAINQAIGRCIRHRTDYGAILLCDPRYQQLSVQQQLSRWLRGAVVNADNFEDCLIPYKLFFDEKRAASQFVAREARRLNPSMPPPVAMAVAGGAEESDDEDAGDAAAMRAAEDGEEQAAADGQRKRRRKSGEAEGAAAASAHGDARTGNSTGSGATSKKPTKAEKRRLRDLELAKKPFKVPGKASSSGAGAGRSGRSSAGAGGTSDAGDAGGGSSSGRNSITSFFSVVGHSTAETAVDMVEEDGEVAQAQEEGASGGGDMGKEFVAIKREGVGTFSVPPPAAARRTHKENMSMSGQNSQDVESAVMSESDDDVDAEVTHYTRTRTSSAPCTANPGRVSTCTHVACAALLPPDATQQDDGAEGADTAVDEDSFCGGGGFFADEEGATGAAAVIAGSAAEGICGVEKPAVGSVTESVSRVFGRATFWSVVNMMSLCFRWKEGAAGARAACLPLPLGGAELFHPLHTQALRSGLFGALGGAPAGAGAGAVQDHVVELHGWDVSGFESSSLTVTDHWSAADGMVYRCLNWTTAAAAGGAGGGCADSDGCGEVVCIAIEIVATGSGGQQRWCDRCYSHDVLLKLLEHAQSLAS